MTLPAPIIAHDAPLPTQEIVKQHWDDESVVVSVVCATFNHAPFIEAALRSFLCQRTRFGFEIIIHDDASTDGTTEIIRDYAAHYPDIIRPLIQTENQFSKGGFRPTPFAIGHARGEFIAVCEGDDYWTDAEKLEKQVAHLRANPDVVMVYTDSSAFDENGALPSMRTGVTHDLSSKDLKRSPSINTLTTCFRNVTGEFPPELYSARFSDQFIWSILGQHGSGAYLANIKPAAYRVHDGGIFSKKTLKARQEMYLVNHAMLMFYFQRMGDQQTASYYRYKMLVSLIQTTGRLKTLELVCKAFWEKIIRRLPGGRPR